MEINLFLYIFFSLVLISILSLIGIFFLFVRNSKIPFDITYVISFSSGILLGNVFIHIFPKISSTSLKAMFFNPFFYVLFGILLYFIIEKFFRWIHCHNGMNGDHKHHLGFMNIVGDGIHNFIDGIAIASAYLVDTNLGILVTISVVLHEIPQEISDFGILIFSGMSLRKALMWNFIGSLSAIFGGVLVIFGKDFILEYSSMFLAIIGGGFLYIALSDLVPEIHKESDTKQSIIQISLIFFGIGVMYFLGLLFSD